MTTFIHFDAYALTHFIQKTTDIKKSLKRRKLDPEQTTSDVPSITLINRIIQFQCPCPVPMSTYPQLSGFPFITPDVKLSISDGLIYVKNKRLNDFNSKILFSFAQGEVSDQEIYLLNLNKSKLTSHGVIVDAPASLKLEFLEDAVVNVEIKFVIKYNCGLEIDSWNNRLRPEVLTRVNYLLDRIISVFPTENEEEIDVKYQAEEINPRLFYKAVSEHTGEMDPVNEGELDDIPELETKLFKFQKKSLKWLLTMENVRLTNSRIEPLAFINTHTIEVFNSDDVHSQDQLIYTLLNKLCFGWKRITINSEIYFFNHITLQIVTRTQVIQYLLNNYNNSTTLPAQGLLCEEMGLGKTVEITALISLNPRPLNQVNTIIPLQLNSFGDVKPVVVGKTTLVIAPDSILKQWMSEIVQLAPSLTVTEYRGVNGYPKLSNHANIIAEYLRKFDVVMTTYATISKELDYAKYSSRNKITRSGKQQQQQQPQEDDEDTPTDSLSSDYKSLFQLSLTSIVPPKIANVKSQGQTETDYERALQDEIALAIAHNKIPHYHSHSDYESPLMLIQFWRVVLDEVQMVSSVYSRAFQSASLIPRFHAWGVSGTPIKKTCDDLHSTLQFLKYYPFIGDLGKFNWSEKLTNIEFVRLFNRICLRHTKAMVHDDIKLPIQHRILLTIPFNAIEQDFYNQKFEECLSNIGLNANGEPISPDWEPSGLVLQYMRLWLIRLRQICNSPQIGMINIGSKKYKKTNIKSNSNVMIQLTSLENLLSEMLYKAYGDIAEGERSNVMICLELGELFEFVYMPELARTVLLAGVVETNRVIQRIKLILQKYIQEYKSKRSTEEAVVDDDDIGVNTSSSDEGLGKLEDVIRGTRIKLRNWLVILHKFYFLIAGSYFQTYDEEFKQLIQQYHVNVDIQPVMIDQICHFNSKRSNELASLVNGVTEVEFEQPQARISPPPDTEDTPMKYYETKYYDLAELTRGEILESSGKLVSRTISQRITTREQYLMTNDDGTTLIPRTTKKFFKQIPMITTSTFQGYAITFMVESYVDKLTSICQLLNNQARVINQWMNELVDILCRPLLSQDQDPQGNEYEETIKDQEKISGYLLVLTSMINDRTLCVNGEGINIVSANPEPGDDFIEQLERKRREVKPDIKTSLSELVTLANSWYEINDLQNELINQLRDRVKVIYDNQKLALVLITKELNINCNGIFNTRIDYYKQLQQISDTVKPIEFPSMIRTELNDKLILDQINKYEQLKRVNCMKMDKSIAKFRYLSGLVGDKDDDEDGLMCIICRSIITIGSLTQCGHKYCKECLEHWLRTSHTCPMCKTMINSLTIYNFTHYKPDLKVKQEEHATDTTALHSIYKPLSPEIISEISHIQLKSTFSSKIDMIVRQVLYLKSRDPFVQIVIFSQWQDMLYILGCAFKACDVSYIGSYGTLTPESGSVVGRRVKKQDSVELFKQDNKITCFLLNAKAQASGLTLVNASHIFLCEPLVNTSLELQAISRIHRIGQTKVTTVWMFAIEGSVEESIVIMSTKKRLKYIHSSPSESEDENEVEVEEDNEDSLVNSVIAQEKDLSKADSLTLMNSGGMDTLVNRGVTQGESELSI
ncbi:putative ATP-dependent helicase IRC20 [Spathaspora sp. JA1]|nr:putative ATP-dependent helicase IRC20 [Spathaspora sp. JA1]